MARSLLWPIFLIQISFFSLVSSADITDLESVFKLKECLWYEQKDIKSVTSIGVSLRDRDECLNVCTEHRQLCRFVHYDPKGAEKKKCFFSLDNQVMRAPGINHYTFYCPDMHMQKISHFTLGSCQWTLLEHTTALDGVAYKATSEEMCLEQCSLNRHICRFGVTWKTDYAQDQCIFNSNKDIKFYHSHAHYTPQCNDSFPLYYGLCLVIASFLMYYLGNGF